MHRPGAAAGAKNAEPARQVTHGIGSLVDVGKRGAELLKCN